MICYDVNMKSYILFGILITLLQEGKKPYNYLAEKYEVSKRTIQRYCLALEMAGIPTFCTCGRSGGIEILGSFNLKNMFFSKQELQRLSTHLHASPLSKLDHIDRQIEEKLNFQFDSKLPTPEPTFIVDHSSWDEELKLNPIIGLLNSELEQKKCFEITYINSKGVPSTRTISPYKFILKDSKWYLFAYCHKRKTCRIFKLNRITELHPSDKTYVENTLSDEEIVNLLSSSFEQIEIKISLDQSLIPDAVEWINNAKITYNENGSAEIIGTATNSYELISKIISYSPKLKLLSPKSLVNKVKQTAKNLTNLYAC